MPVSWHDMIWLPQQLWRFRDMPFGIWTVCYHHNTWGQRELTKFENDIKSFQARIVSVNDIILETHAHAWIDHFYLAYGYCQFDSNASY